jgi:HlyD family secretion protein
MTVSVDIEVARCADALVVPASAVNDLNGPAPWVLKVVEGRADRAVVKVGLRGEGKVEILEGLAEGDLVIPAAAKLSEGRRVRAAPRA